MPEALADRVRTARCGTSSFSECTMSFAATPLGRLCCNAWLGTLFWPHPFVYFVNTQLAQAHEEVCDNYVLQRGDPCGYATHSVAARDRVQAQGHSAPGAWLAREPVDAGRPRCRARRSEEEFNDWHQLSSEDCPRPLLSSRQGYPLHPSD